MWRRYRLLALVLLSVLSQTTHAFPFTFEARSLGMGGAAVATADLGTAAWANPAMLANQKMERDWSMLIGFGAFLRDDDDLHTDVKDFQDADERREAALDASDAAGVIRSTAEMRLILDGIDSKIIAPEATAAIAVGAAFESFSMAISARSDLIAGGVVTNISCTPLIDPGCDSTELTSDEFNILNVEGVLAADVDSDILDNDDNKADLGTFETIDLGFAVDLSDSFRLGLSLSNLITDDFDLGNQTLNLDTGARLGVAYFNEFMTIAADLDLIENEPLLANDSFEGLKTQYLAVGAEFNAFEYVKFRLGATKNIASGISDGAKDIEYTAGVGFWLGFNLDVAALINDNTAGVFLQTGFQF
jgi:hypothetical protein